MKRIATLVAALGVTALGYAATRPAVQGPPAATKFHKLLAQDVGVWTAEGEMFFPMPMKFEAVETVAMVGELWQVSDFESQMMGMPFHGHHSIGYDPAKKKFVATWVDSMTPSMAIMEGDWDEPSRAIDMRYRAMQMGQEQAVHSIHRHLDDDTREYRSFLVNADGSETLTMKIVYRRGAAENAGGEEHGQ